MATGWNVKKVYSELNTNIKTDVNNIYQDLVNINAAVDKLGAIDSSATTKNGEDISNFSGHKAVRYFHALKKEGGYFANSEKFYGKLYEFCQKMVNRGLKRSMTQNIKGYQTIDKWQSTLPRNNKYLFNHQMPTGAKEDVVNVSKNVLSLKDEVNQHYESYKRHLSELEGHLKTLKKYVPDGLDNSIGKLVTRINKRFDATEKRKNQLNNYVYGVVLDYLLENTNDETEISSMDNNIEDATIQSIDGE